MSAGPVVKLASFSEMRTDRVEGGVRRHRASDPLVILRVFEISSSLQRTGLLMWSPWGLIIDRGCFCVLRLAFMCRTFK